MPHKTPFIDYPGEKERLIEEQFLKNMKEFKQYLRDNLELMTDDAGQKYYSCGFNHEIMGVKPGPHWDPFRYLKQFCAKKKIYWKKFLTDLELDLLMRLRCECIYASMGLEEENRIRRLQSAFGIDFGLDCDVD